MCDWRSASTAHEPGCTTRRHEPERDADAIGNPVEHIEIAGYLRRPLKDFDRSSDRGQENDQPELALGPTQAAKRGQDGECAGVIELVIAETDIDPELLEPRLRQQREDKNRNERNDKCGSQDD